MTHILGLFILVIAMFWMKTKPPSMAPTFLGKVIESIQNDWGVILMLMLGFWLFAR